jgi:hypothetical protein
MRTRPWKFAVLAIAILALVAGAAFTTSYAASSAGGQPVDQVIRQNARQMVEEGEQTFRFDTFENKNENVNSREE